MCFLCRYSAPFGCPTSPPAFPVEILPSAHPTSILFRAHFVPTHTQTPQLPRLRAPLWGSPHFCPPPRSPNHHSTITPSPIHSGRRFPFAQRHLLNLTFIPAAIQIHSSVQTQGVQQTRGAAQLSSAQLLSLPSLGLPIQMREGSERGALLQPPLGLLFLIPSYAPIPITAPSGSIAAYFSPSRTTPGRGAFSPPPSFLPIEQHTQTDTSSAQG